MQLALQSVRILLDAVGLRGLKVRCERKADGNVNFTQDSISSETITA